MPFEIRHLKNQRRGTGLTYAIIPIDEAKNITPKEVEEGLKKAYGIDAEVHEKGTPYYETTSGEKPYIPTKRFPFQPETYEELRAIASNQDIKEANLLFRDREKGEQGSTRDTIVKVIKQKERLVFIPVPYLHDITGNKRDREDQEISAYSDLTNILKDGFETRGGGSEETNAIVKKSRVHKKNPFGYWGGGATSKGDPHGIAINDRYTLELFPDIGYMYEDASDVSEAGYAIKKASTKRILAVDIKLNPDTTSSQREEKMAFYRKEITEKYGIPVRFYMQDTKDGKKEVNPKRIFLSKKSLEQRLSAIITIVGIGASLFFLSSNVTGNAIGNISRSSGSWIGIILFVIGLVGAVWYFKSKK
jgi:hypothetical protein